MSEHLERGVNFRSETPEELTPHPDEQQFEEIRKEGFAGLARGLAKLRARQGEFGGNLFIARPAHSVQLPFTIAPESNK